MSRGALVHRGVVRASGLFFSNRLYGAEKARSRILRGWERGTRVYAVDAGHVWLFPTSELMNTDASPGMVLVEQRGVYASAPFTQEEQAAYARSAPTCVIVDAGSIQVSSLRDNEVAPCVRVVVASIR